MRLDSANTAFVSLAGLAAATWAVVSLAACSATAVVVDLVVTGGGATTASVVGAAVVLTVLSAAGSLRGWWSLRRQLLATESLAKSIRASRHPTPQRVAHVAPASTSLDRIDVVRSNERFALTYGYLRPRVAISTGLIDASTDGELSAVLEHEAYHVRNYDPIKLLVARWLEAVLFFLPVLRDLRARYLLGRELAAHRRAAARCGRRPLARALTHAVAPPEAFAAAAGAALGGTELLRVRVDQLETGNEPLPPPVTRLAVAASAVAIAVLLVVAVLSTQMTGGVMAMPMTHGSGPAGVVGTTTCAAAVSWLMWRIARWLSVAPRPA